MPAFIGLLREQHSPHLKCYCYVVPPLFLLNISTHYITLGALTLIAQLPLLLDPGSLVSLEAQVDSLLKLTRSLRDLPVQNHHCSLSLSISIILGMLHGSLVSY